MVLAKTSKNQFYPWSTSIDDRTFVSHLSIEEACAELELHGVIPDELDVAIMDMYAKENDRAHFGVTGAFIYTDSSR